MHFSSTLTALATSFALVSQGSAYVLEIYSGAGCQGSSSSVNVWDNSCATWQGGFNSYKVSAYGGSHQKAYFFVPSNCGDLVTANSWHWADGGDGNFQVSDNCYNMGTGVVINGLASYSS